MTRFLSFIIPLLLASVSVCTTACREDGEDGPVKMTFTDMATFLGNGTHGSGASFSIRQDGDSPEVILTSEISLANTDAGTRMLIMYANEDNLPYASGPVELLGASRVTQGPLKPELDPLWDTTPVYLLSVWRTDTWLNFRVRLPYSTEPRVFSLMADQTTLGSEWPEVYLAHIMDPGETLGHDRGYYASFDISSVWLDENVKGIILHVNNSNLDKHIFTIAKP